MQGIIRNSISMSRRILSHHIKPGDTVIDATCCRGQDTLYLARLAGKTGRGLSQSRFTVLKWEFVNQINNPPGLIFIHKFSEGKR